MGEYDDPSYNQYGELTRQGLDQWQDEEGGWIDLFYYHGMDAKLDRDDPELLSMVNDYRAALAEFMPIQEDLADLCQRDK